MSHEEREHRSAPVLTKERMDKWLNLCGESEYRYIIYGSHEALRAERDAALAEVARLTKLKDRLRHIHTLSEDDDDE